MCLVAEERFQWLKTVTAVNCLLRVYAVDLGTKYFQRKIKGTQALFQIRKRSSHKSPHVNFIRPTVTSY